jgi:hypothetical protein
MRRTQGKMSSKGRGEEGWQEAESLLGAVLRAAFQALAVGTGDMASGDITQVSV